jgi:transcriptional regulator GlxA family with amidase domain
LFNLRGNKPVIENVPLYQAQFERLLADVQRDHSVNSTNYSQQLIGLLSHFTRNDAESNDSLPATRDEIVDAAIEYIWNYSHAVLDVPSVARAVGVGRRTIERRFKALKGRSVKEEIRFCQVSRAASLLRETEMPIKEIVQRAGFGSEEHLRRMLHKAFGKSALAFRTQERADAKGG